MILYPKLVDQLSTNLHLGPKALYTQQSRRQARQSRGCISRSDEAAALRFPCPTLAQRRSMATAKFGVIFDWLELEDKQIALDVSPLSLEFASL